MAISVVWFKRDLRVDDHAALCAGAQRGKVIPLYIVEPEYWHLPDTSARQWEFTRESVQDLSLRLAQLGQPLIVRVGSAVQVLSQLRREIAFDAIFSHEETGNDWTFQRDKCVAQWAAAEGVQWAEFAQAGIERRSVGRNGWACRRDAFMARAPWPVPKGLAPLHLASDNVPGAGDLALVADPCPGRQKGGRAAADDLLHSFLHRRGQTYRKDMSSPVAGEWSCSRLSPYLALGVVSPRHVLAASFDRKRREKGAGTNWSKSLKSFDSRLAWRDHFIQKLEDQPSIETKHLHPSFAGLRGCDDALLQAWSDGQTGVPFVDACMRYLTHTGWLNFRMRSMLMAFACYHLWMDWRDPGLILARRFTDYEPGIHWSQVQMQAGTTGINTIRIYNPIKQGQDQDPTGEFTRKWVPELDGIAPEFLQDPWRRGGWPGYPAPVVDVAAAASFARKTMWGLRKDAQFRERSKGIVAKHASRKRPRGAPAKANRQLRLDL